MQLHGSFTSQLVAALTLYCAWLPTAQLWAAPISDLLLVFEADGQGYTAQHTLISDGELLTLELPPARIPLLTRFSGPERLTFSTAHDRNANRIALWSGAAITRYRRNSGDDLKQLEGVSEWSHALDVETLIAEQDNIDLHSTVTWVLPDNARLLSYDDTAALDTGNHKPGNWQINDNVVNYIQGDGPLRKLSIRFELLTKTVLKDTDPCLGITAGTDVCAPDKDADGTPDYRDICLADAGVTRTAKTGAGAETDIGADPDTAEDTLTQDVLGCRHAAIITLEGVQFQSGQSYLDIASRTVLDRVALALQRDSGHLFEVGAHTDNGGGRAHNQRLSENRADAVRHYLMLRGIGPNQLHAQGYGETSPAFDNATVQGRRANRRIELRRLD